MSHAQNLNIAAEDSRLYKEEKIAAEDSRLYNYCLYSERFKKRFSLRR